eukprot:CAMPEP_0175230438 /NCGR_PEP_ID=MMETSP0093-20121207/24947_1 /TAXON_ID=311494 /ORGANISM="Alexandrium monilatum, Strain CCMP3105" /LENGTH=80 /DNA_ID=CAMNT_0016524271 /DNA_START=53 /DNA_END=291 /DNA_ORIENTATION=-
MPSGLLQSWLPGLRGSGDMECTSLGLPAASSGRLDRAGMASCGFPSDSTCTSALSAAAGLPGTGAASSGLLAGSASGDAS